ncbi:MULTISPECIES: 5-formyltetrahydrofolate cyclo-ligase [Rhizobium/Agrobacterium group]|uniref:5-formyltetrahydrofolate cyclo-ligase n=2 Tax=Neorhizobium TaxID=1525371 RepID=A0ABV0LXR7_9HYPH|nr:MULTISPECIES: 5-formyltetrahydrofolate cyclo-ligase [Rhizobium/Agrobacterium group]KGD92096.1 5-formyltetrahydrofolate cyclo-ligase [Rhizobium sp. YS-1r]MCC2611418.1 5-formyltetrahydrofolate cyclo-ligase [Neorhizobium petrolearium]WGI66611.1 5-formyltetrahydrofolate cyclo-ligase [Neorhizobium petrolearium]
MADGKTKAELRGERLAARDAILPVERIEKSLAIASHGAGAIDFEAGAIVSGFLPIRSEVDLRPLMASLRDRSARLCVPVILDKKTIVFRELVRGADLVPGTFGTFGPGPEAAELDPDVMLVPLSAFDRQGHRIGYGGGYYDRAIHRLQQKGLKPKLIGIAFDCQEVASVPFEPHDIRLDAVLTESGYRPFEHSGQA